MHIIILNEQNTIYQIRYIISQNNYFIITKKYRDKSADISVYRLLKIHKFMSKLYIL